MTRLALCLLLLATGASTQLAHAEPGRQLPRTKKIQDLHPHWRLGAGLMRGISCEQAALDRRSSVGRMACPGQ